VPIIRVPRFKQASNRQSSRAAEGHDGLDAFHMETTERQGDRQIASDGGEDRRTGGLGRRAVAFVGAITAMGLAGGGFLAYQKFPAAPAPASLSLQTTPTNARVSINGETRGVTPLTLALAPGAYQVNIAAPSGQERTLEVALKAGDTIVQHIEWAEAPPPAKVTTGSLRVQTEPPGQPVFIDDSRRGISPLTISDLPAGEHRLSVATAGGNIRRSVTITAGETLSVVVAPTSPAATAGYVRVTSPVVLQLQTNGDLVGSSDSARIMLPPGEHDLAMSNDSLNFTRTQRVTVSAGRTTEVRVSVPNAPLSINALPWADVWLNDEPLGTTPLANLSRPIGTYRVTFRHPQLGERQATVTLKARETARIGIDMRQQQ
jgi:hypothetical protein